MKAFKALIAIGILALAVPASASSITYEYISDVSVDGPNKDGAASTGTVTYTLVIDDVTGAAEFSIDGSITAAEVWQAGWFSFKLDEGTTALALSGLSWDPAATTGPWAINDGSTNVLQAGGGYGSITQGGRSAIYVSSLAQGGAADDVTQGVCLTAGFCSVN